MSTRMSLRRRASGVLLHITSLPSLHGIGDLGPEAYRFADFLFRSGQTWWQMFPLGPLGYGGSPYQVLSAFAGNPLLISLEKLRDDGLLSAADVRSSATLSKKRVTYDEVCRFKEIRFKKAFRAFVDKHREKDRAFHDFCVKHDYWLSDYALFRALKDQHAGVSWDKWEPDVRNRREFALQTAREKLAEPVLYHKFLQYEFFKQIAELKAYCVNKGLGLIGDVPIFVAHDSADVWSNPDIFWLDSTGKSTVVAGVPPDYFSRTGQLWGNPHYRWAVLRERDYDWWMARFRAAFEFHDVVRLDHFIGFYRYWEVAANAKTAEHGRWVLVPGEDFFTLVFKQFKEAEFIAEDLGSLTPEVKALRDKFNLPGMRVLQFAFGADPESRNYQPHSYIRRSVVYTGTHDNDTSVGWFKDEGSAASTRSRDDIKRERKFALRYMNSNGREVHWDLIRLALASVGETAIIPAQDLLGLGSEARMNLPGTIRGNWEWRLTPGALNEKVAERLREITDTYDRLNRKAK